MALFVTEVALPTEVTGPVKLALVVTVPAVSPAAVPVIFVPTKALGVPKSGVIRVGLVCKTTVLPVPVVVAAIIAVPSPANTGAVTVVESVMTGVVVGLVT